MNTPFALARMSLVLTCLILASCWSGDDDPNAVAREDSEARRDRSVPTLALLSPTSGDAVQTTDGSLPVAGTAQDDRVITRVTWVNDRGGSGVAQQDGTASLVAWNVAAINLSEGSNQIVVRAYDKAGNSATKSLLVNFTPADSGGSAGADPAPAPSTEPAPAPMPPAPSGAVSAAPGELLWSDPGTWGGAVPAAGAEVVVPAGTTVVLDRNTAVLGNLRIEGTLKFGRTDVELKSAAIQVSGALLIGSADAPHLNRATITLSGTPLSSGNNGIARGLNVQGGRLELYGAVPQPLWTRLGDHAAAGATSLTLAAPANWRAGDTIAVAPSDFYGVASTERLVMAADASGTRVNATMPLAAFRWGRLQYVTSQGMSLTPEAGYTPPVTPAPTVLDERAPVANLSRNIVIQGVDDAAWRNDGFGAHVMVMDLRSKVVVDGVEFRRVGQAGHLGRYPFHWHMLSYAGGSFIGDATGHVIRNSALWQSANRCIVVHATNGVQVKNNICQDIAGHAFFLEDAVERRNVLEGNLALKVRSPAASKLLKVHEGTVFQAGASGFWLTNPDNTVRGNVSGDAQGNGFWLAFPPKPTGPSGNVAMDPNNLPFGVFDDNVALSNGQPGINLDWVPIDEAGNVQPMKYLPTVDGAPNTYTNQLRMTMRRNTVYKNGGNGLWNRVTKPDYPEWVSADNAGVHFGGAGDDGVITRSLLVGQSLNHSGHYPEGADPPSGFATYHSTYAMRDNTLVNFAFVDGKLSGAFRTNDYYTLGVDKGTVRNGNNRLTATHPGFRMLPPLLDGKPLANRHWTYAGALWDPHGYWGPKGNFWTFDHPFLSAGGGCQAVAPAGRNGLSCSGEFYGVGAFQTDFDNSRYSFQAPIDVQRQDANGAPLGTWSVGDGATSTMLGNMRHFAARPGGRYVLRFPGKPNPRWFAMTVGNAWRATDSMLMAVAFDGGVTASGYTVSGFEHARQAPPDSSYARAFTPAASLGEVAASSGNKLWQDRANNLVWFKVQGGMAYPNASNLTAESDESVYRPLSVVLRGG
jgi:G8 domain/Glucodextranase, domain B